MDSLVEVVEPASPRTAPSGTSRRPASEQIARQWLVTFAEVCGKEITPALAAIWAQQLGDIPAELLERACNQLMKTWTSGFLPTPGNVRAQLDQAEGKGVELQAEAEWEKALRVASEFWHPDIGLYRDAPKLSAAAWHALKAAGGLYHLSQCSSGDLQWARKRFVANYHLVHEANKVQHLIGDGEARRILERLTSGSEKATRQLASTKREDDSELFFEVPRPRGALVSQPSVIAAMSEEEFAESRRREKERIAAWIAEHPELMPPKTPSNASAQSVDGAPASRAAAV